MCRICCVTWLSFCRVQNLRYWCAHAHCPAMETQGWYVTYNDMQCGEWNLHSGEPSQHSVNTTFGTEQDRVTLCSQVIHLVTRDCSPLLLDDSNILPNTAPKAVIAVQWYRPFSDCTLYHSSSHFSSRQVENDSLGYHLLSALCIFQDRWWLLDVHSMQVLVIRQP